MLLNQRKILLFTLLLFLSSRLIAQIDYLGQSQQQVINTYGIPTEIRGNTISYSYKSNFGSDSPAAIIFEFTRNICSGIETIWKYRSYDKENAVNDFTDLKNTFDGAFSKKKVLSKFKIIYSGNEEKVVLALEQVGSNWIVRSTIDLH